MAQVVNNPKFVAQMAQGSFEKCQKIPDAMVRTGHALALGCLYRYFECMESGQHLRNIVSILTALAKDHSSSLVQVCSLHGLTLIADSGGPMLRQFVNQSLVFVMNSSFDDRSSSMSWKVFRSIDHSNRTEVSRKFKSDGPIETFFNHSVLYYGKSSTFISSIRGCTLHLTVTCFRTKCCQFAFVCSVVM